MPTTEFAKDFKQLLKDFNIATQRAIKALDVHDAPDADDGDEEEPTEAVEDLNDGLDRLYVRVRKDCLKFDKLNLELPAQRKKIEEVTAKKNKTSKTPVSSTKEVEALLKPYEAKADKLEKSLDLFVRAVRSQLGERKDLGEKFGRATQVLLASVRKLDVQVDKVVSAELKRKPRKDEKKQEVTPTKFSEAFKNLLQKYPEGKGTQPNRDYAEAEAALKRVDVNKKFDEVVKLCEIADSALKTLIKSAGKTNSKLVGPLKSLLGEVEKYDNYMFLLSRLG